MKLGGGWIKKYNEKLLYLYSSPNIIRKSNSRMRWGRQVACTGKEEKCVKRSGGETRRRPLGRPRRRWADNKVLIKVGRCELDLSGRG